MPERSFRGRRATLRARELRQTVSKTEHKLWPHLRGGALGVSFRRQHPVGPYFADYYCAPLKLCIEIDGPDHDLAADSERDAWTQERGITVLRFPVQEMDRNLVGVVSTVMDQIRFLQNTQAARR